MGKKKTEVPDRWTQYLPLGRRMPGTRFIAFKVPLKKAFDWRLPENERFSPTDLINQVREQNEELGLIIDLTYTTRYYGPEDLPSTVQHCKILTIGQEVPSNDSVRKFKNAVKKFLMENQHNDMLIGVHCTHGLNRTGYLVCRYLIDIEGMDPKTAIELFNSYRGHPIERKSYIDHLKRGPHRRINRAVVRGSGWNVEHCGPVPSPGFEIQYSAQSVQRFPWKGQRHFPARRGGHGQNPHSFRRPYHTQNFVPCYDEGQYVCSPQYSPASGGSHQRSGYSVQYNRREFCSPYQQRIQGHEGPNFHEQNFAYPPQQGRYKINRQSYPNF